MTKVLLIKPVSKPRMTQRDKWAQRPAVLAYRTYCDELRLKLPNYELTPHLGITFYLPMPPSWSARKRQEKAGTEHDQKPDIDNLLKGWMDAFKSEDKHVAIVYASKFWAESGSIELHDE